MDRAMARGDNAAFPLVTRISPPSTVLRDSTEYFVLGTQLSPVLVLVLPISISPVTDSGTRFVHFYLTYRRFCYSVCPFLSHRGRSWYSVCPSLSHRRRSWYSVCPSLSHLSPVLILGLSISISPWPILVLGLSISISPVAVSGTRYSPVAASGTLFVHLYLTCRRFWYSPVAGSGTLFVHLYLTCRRFWYSPVAGSGTLFVHLYLTCRRFWYSPVAGSGTRFVHLYLTCRRFWYLLWPSAVNEAAPRASPITVLRSELPSSLFSAPPTRDGSAAFLSLLKVRHSEPTSITLTGAGRWGVSIAWTAAPKIFQSLKQLRKNISSHVTTEQAFFCFLFVNAREPEVQP